MRKVFDEVREKVMKRFSGFGVFLAAIWTEFFFNNKTAIQAVFFFPKFSVAHWANFL